MRIRKLFTLSVVSIILFGCTFPQKTDSKQLQNIIDFYQLDVNDRREIECLTDNIHFEAGAESQQGKIAVAFVTMNRVNHPKYPSSVCDVIKQRDKKTCQFSWVCQKKTTAKKMLTNGHEEKYNYMRDLAMYVYLNYQKLHDPTKGAIFYHANYVNPNWKKVRKTVTIGKHIFYKTKPEVKDI